MGIYKNISMGKSGQQWPKILRGEVVAALGGALAVLFGSDVLEVVGSTVADVSVLVIKFLAFGAVADPSFGYEDVAVGRSDEVAHPRVVGVDVGFGVEVLGLVRLHLVESTR